MELSIYWPNWSTVVCSRFVDGLVISEAKRDEKLKLDGPLILFLTPPMAHAKLGVLRNFAAAVPVAFR